jgi:hypothetical protein
MLYSHPITIHVSNYLCSDLLCFPQSVQYIFLLAFQHYFSHIEFNSELFYCDFCLLFSASSHFFPFVAEVVSVNSSPVPL